MATQQYDDELRGVLFKNDKKGNERAPDYKGKCQIEGTEYEMAAWLRRSKRTNEMFMSISFEDVTKRQQQQDGAAPAATVADDDIPF